jgi:hypothetical protein
LGEKWPVNLVCDFDFHVNRKVLLRAANLRHGTDDFTLPPKEGMLWIFSPEKSDGFVRFFNLFVSCHCSGIELSMSFLYRTSFVLELVGVIITRYPRNFRPSPPEDAAYWPDTQRTPLAKERTNGILASNFGIFEKSWVLLHAPKLGHGTDYFTSPPKEGMLWIFPAGKIRRLRSRANPRSWVPEASMLTSRPPKSLFGPLF